GVGLIEHRFYHLPKKRLRRAVRRHNDADGHRPVPCSFSLLSKLFFGRTAALIILLIMNLPFFKPLHKPCHKIPKPIMLQIAEPFFDIIRRQPAKHLKDWTIHRTPQWPLRPDPVFPWLTDNTWEDAEDV